MALFDEVDLVYALIEVDNDLVRLEDATVHADHNVILEALLGLFKEELHVVCFEVSKQGLNDLVLQVGRKAIKELELIADQIEVMDDRVLDVALDVDEETTRDAPLLVRVLQLVNPEINLVHSSIDQSVEAWVASEHWTDCSHDQREECQAEELDEHAVDVLGLGASCSFAISHSCYGGQNEEECHPVDVMRAVSTLVQLEDPRSFSQATDRNPPARKDMRSQEEEDDELYERDELTDFVSVVCEPAEEDFLEDQAQWIKHPVPVHQSDNLEVEDLATFKGHETWECGNAV